MLKSETSDGKEHPSTDNFPHICNMYNVYNGIIKEKDAIIKEKDADIKRLCIKIGELQEKLRTEKLNQI